jgi:hypothetical protein
MRTFLKWHALHPSVYCKWTVEVKISLQFDTIILILYNLLRMNGK